MIQYILLGRTAAPIRLNTTFRGLSVLPEDGDGASPRNVVFKRIDAAVRPRRLVYCTNDLFERFIVSFVSKIN
jgi:hypothetical protein